MKSLIVVSLIFVHFTVLGQNQGISFINYTQEDGLCDNQVTSIGRDARGLIWIGTQGGFNRFDGFGFKKYYPTELTKNRQITDKTIVYFESTPNVILVQLGNNKGYSFNTVSQKMKPISSLKNVLVYDFHRLNKNTIAVASFDCCYLLDNDLNILETVRPDFQKKGAVVNIRSMSENELLIYSSREFLKWNRLNNKKEKIHLKIDLKEEFNVGFLCLLMHSMHTNFYVSNYFTGLYKVDFQGNVLTSWSNKSGPFQMTANPNQMVFDKVNESSAWISGISGITHLNLKTNRTTHFSMNKDNPASLIGDYTCGVFFDKDNNLWVLTQSGVSCQNKFSQILNSWNLETSFENPLMNIVKTKNGQVYASQYFQGVYEVKEDKNKSKPIAPNKIQGSWFLFEDGDYLVQGGKGTEIHYYHIPSGKIETRTFLKSYFTKANLVVMGFKCKNGEIWYSGNFGGGLVRIKKTGEIKHYSKDKNSFSGSYFTICKEDKNGDLWLSSNKSQVLLHWKSKEETFEEIDFSKLFAKKNYFQSVIYYHLPDNNGNIWLGFDGSGLVKYNIKTRKIYLFDKNNGLPYSIICNLVLDSKNRLWIGSKKGLSCLSANHRNIFNFNLKNGFPTESFETSCSYFDEKKNQIWMASNDLLLRFDPDKILALKKQMLQVFIDEFQVNNTNRYSDEKSKYQFKPDENNLQISFIAMNFKRANDVVFSYKLAGASEKWISCGNNKNINIVGLPHGNYTFNVRAKLIGDTFWTYNKTPMNFTIQTPWYRSWWFVASSILLAIFIVYTLVRSYFVRKMEQHKAKIEKQKAVQNERDRIAYDMHDDLGSGLTKISYLSQMAIAKKDKEEELTKINKTSLELVENMSEIIWAMKVENDSLQDLLTYLKLYAVEYLEFNGIDLALVLPEVYDEVTISGEARRNIFLIFKEALHNVVKHAQANKVKIMINLQPNFTLVIADNGKGFNPLDKSESQGNGLRNMNKRTEKLNGSLAIENENGTRLIFSFPFDTLQ